MSDLRKAAQQVLEAIDYLDAQPEAAPDDAETAIEALRAALAQPEQEPLTEGEIDEIIYSMAESDRANDRFTFARAIEKAHRIGGEW